MLYELLTGEVPFSGDNFVAVAMRHVSEPPPSVLAHRPDCPVRVDLAIQRAMAKDPADRFASMDELCTELEGCLAELDGARRGGRDDDRPAAAPAPACAAANVSVGRFPVGVALIVLLAALLVAGGAYLLLSNDSAKKALHVSSASPKPVQLQGLLAYDPEGDGSEHGDEARSRPITTPATSWDTRSTTAASRRAASASSCRRRARSRSGR